MYATYPNYILADIVLLHVYYVCSPTIVIPRRRRTDDKFSSRTSYAVQAPLHADNNNNYGKNSNEYRGVACPRVTANGLVARGDH